MFKSTKSHRSHDLHSQYVRYLYTINKTQFYDWKMSFAFFSLCQIEASNEYVLVAVVSVVVVVVVVAFVVASAAVT